MNFTLLVVCIFVSIFAVAESRVEQTRGERGIKVKFQGSGNRIVVPPTGAGRIKVRQLKARIHQANKDFHPDQQMLTNNNGDILDDEEDLDEEGINEDEEFMASLRAKGGEEKASEPKGSDKNIPNNI